MNRNNALAGVLVADAAAMGLHWLYDQEQIQLVEKTGDILFRAPDGNHFKDKRGFFAHAGKRAGDLSHYGESARIVGQLVADGTYTTEAHRQIFLETFGPCGSYAGYADRPTKALVAKMLTDADKLSDPSGMDDNQMPALCSLAGLFAAQLPSDRVKPAVEVISVNADVLSGAHAVYRCMELVAQGVALPQALQRSADATDGPIGDLLQQALTLETDQPLEAATHFGLACYVEHALPVTWYLLRHAVDFESVVRDNIRCGGDCCGRSMALGAIAGLAFDIPATMIARMANARVPVFD